MKSIILVLTLIFSVIIPVGTISNDIPISDNQLIIINQTGGWLPENFTQDLMEEIIGAFWNDDGSGVVNKILNCVPILGGDCGTALLFPVFLLLFTGVYFKLRKIRGG